MRQPVPARLGAQPPRLKEAGVEFVHADVRQLDDLARVGAIDALVECSAEPSVHGRVDGGADYVVAHEPVGAYHCLELAAPPRRRRSSSCRRAASIPSRRSSGSPTARRETRFELRRRAAAAGARAAGIAEDFPLGGARTLYGATKLAAELLIAEYAESYGLRASINRCGVVAGPWQMGKVDQGVFTHWMLAYYFGRDRSRTSATAAPASRCATCCTSTISSTRRRPARATRSTGRGATFNVGGGREGSLSLLETTALCREITGQRRRRVGPVAETRPGDVPIYLSDCTAPVRAHRLAAAPRRRARSSTDTRLDPRERAPRRGALG